MLKATPLFFCLGFVCGIGEFRLSDVSLQVKRKASQAFLAWTGRDGLRALDYVSDCSTERT